MADGYFLTEVDRDALVPLIKSEVAPVRRGPDRVRRIPRHDLQGLPLLVRPKKGTTVPGMFYRDYSVSNFNDLDFPHAGQGAVEVWDLEENHAYDPELPDTDVNSRKTKLSRVVLDDNADPKEYWEIDVVNLTPYELFYTHFSQVVRSRGGTYYLTAPPIVNWLVRLPSGGIPAQGSAECEIGYLKSGTAPEADIGNETDSYVWLKDEADAPLKRKVFHLGPTSIDYSASNYNVMQTKYDAIGRLLVDVEYCQ